MRGLGVLIMLQGHVVDAWVRPQDRTSEWFWLSQFLGGFPAPIFLFLVGVSLALALDRMRSKGASITDLAGKVLRRGGWILFLAYAFRIEQFLVWYPHSEVEGIFKIDTLNCIAASTLLIGLLSVVLKSRVANITAMAAAHGLLGFVTALASRMKGLPAFPPPYLNGAQPPSYFSVFPWAAFTFAGITFGYTLLEARSKLAEGEFFKRVAVAGVCAYAAGAGMSLTSIFEYGFFDYLLTSPHYFLVLLGYSLLILYGAYLWSGRKSAWRWSPLVTLGRASLIVYWVHIEIVYGRLFAGFGQSLTLSNAAMQLLWLAPLMLVLASAGRIRSAVSELASRMRLVGLRGEE